MGAPHHNELEDNEFPYGPLDQWYCPGCFKAIDPSRPPEFNQDNCCCEELGPDARKEILALEQTIAQMAHVSLNKPESCISDESVKTPEGPERQVPIGNDSPPAYLLLAPGPGHNEKRHCRSLVSRSSLTMTRFMKDQPPSFIDMSLVTAPPSFLSQGVYIEAQVSNKATKGTRASQYSDGSWPGDMSGSLHALGNDMTLHIGSWATGEEEYPPCMTDSVIFGPPESDFLA
ncbi:hypothetical protein F5884DRAFT_363330 [Xylogone sp. PMI_703]|nr:hypothetical protein F5884DRAFT_363330 [Xylogone sp. PMI_703]